MNWQVLKRAVSPLASRKVRVALVTVVAAYAAEYGLGLSEEVIYTIISVGVAVILGIAHEDNGAKQAVRVTAPGPGGDGDGKRKAGETYT